MSNICIVQTNITDNTSGQICTPPLTATNQEKCTRDSSQPFSLQKWDRYGYGFGSDGYLYDFVKRSPKYAPDYYGYGSDGFLYDFAKRAPRSRYYPKSRNYRYGFGSDGYLYDFVKK